MAWLGTPPVRTPFWEDDSPHTTRSASCERTPPRSHVGPSTWCVTDVGQNVIMKADFKESHHGIRLLTTDDTAAGLLPFRPFG